VAGDDGVDLGDRSSIWRFVGFTTTSGSTSPVGRTICSATTSETSSS